MSEHHLFEMEAIQKLKSDKIKARMDGVKLLHSLVIGHDILHKGDDTTYLRILGALFDSVEIERRLYVRAQKAAIEDRLNALGLTIRATVTNGCQKFRKKSIRHFLSNIIPAYEEDIVAPLRSHYIKALRVLITFAPHLEQMGNEQVFVLINYCRDFISSRIRRQSEMMGFDEEVPIHKAAKEQSHLKKFDLDNVQNIMACLDQIIKSYANRLSVFPDEYTRQITVLAFDYIRHYKADVIGITHAVSALTCIAEYFTTNDISSAGGICADFLSLMNYLWPTRSIVLRCHLAALFLVLHPLISIIQRDDERVAGLSEILQSLFDVIYDGYISNINVERLQMDQVAFGSRPVEAEIFPVMKFPSFQLHCEDPEKAELPWSTVFIMSHLMLQLELNCETLQVPPTDERPAKRHKSLTNLQSLVGRLTVDSEIATITVLQILSFAFHIDARFSERLELGSFLHVLWQLVDHEDISVQCWSMLCIASLVSSSKPELLTPEVSSPSTWMKLWKVVLRKSCLPGTCRFSSHLLRELLRSHVLDLSELEQSILGTLEVDQIGAPAVLCDNSLRYWEMLFCIREYLGGELSSNLHEFFLKWFGNKWIPSESIGFPGYHHRCYYSDSSTFLRILSSFGCFEIIQSSVPPLSLKGVIGKACQRLKIRSNIFQYLIEGQCPHASIKRENINSKDIQIPYLRVQGVPKLIQLLINKLAQTIKFWEEALNSKKTPAVEQIQYWGVRMYEIVAFTWAAISQEEHQEGAMDLLYKADAFLSVLRNCLEISTAIKPHIKTEIFACIMDLSLKTFNHLSNISRISIRPLLETQLELFFQTMTSQKSVNPNTESLIDPDFHSSSSALSSDQEAIPFEDEFRKYESCHWSIEKWNYSVIEDIRYQYDLHLCSQQLSPSYIQERVRSLGRMQSLCAAQSFLHHVDRLNAADFSMIMKALAEQFLEGRHDQYLYGLCDCVVVTFIEFLIASVPTWMSSPPEEKIGTILQFFLKLILSGTTSTISRIKAVDLLLCILERFPDLSLSFDGSHRESIRSLVIQFFNVPEIGVFAFIVGNAARLFGCFNDQEHRSLFGDIVKTLDSDAQRDTDERIQFRAELLLNLIRISDQIYQTAVYHLFELASFASAEDTVRRAFDTLASSVGLTFTELFERHYASNTFHWWLGAHNNIDNFSFSILGFSNFQEFVNTWGHEIYSQLLIMNRIDEAHVFIQNHGLDVKDMFNKAFVFLAAHGFLSGTQSGQQHPAISLAKTTLGELAFRHNLTQSMPDIIYTMTRCTKMDKNAVEILGKRKYTEQSSKLATIIALGSSENIIPQLPRPPYSLDVTLSALEELLLVSHVKGSDIWSPSSLVYMCRRLLRDAFHQAHPSLACIVLKQIRLLVILAGTAGFAGYSYTMLLRGLCEFIGNPAGSADSMGLLRYLLSDHCPGFHTEVDAAAAAIFTIYQHFKTSTCKGLPDKSLPKSWFVELLDSCGKRPGLEKYASVLDILFKRMFTADKNLDSDAWNNIVAFMNFYPASAITDRMKLELLHVLSADFITPTQTLDKLLSCVTRTSMLDKLLRTPTNADKAHSFFSSLSVRYIGIKCLNSLCRNAPAEDILQDRGLESSGQHNKFTKILELILARLDSQKNSIVATTEKVLRVWYRDNAVKKNNKRIHSRAINIMEMPFLGKADEPSNEARVYVSKFTNILNLTRPPAETRKWTRSIVSYFIFSLFNEEPAITLIDLLLVDCSFATTLMPHLIEFYLLQASTEDRASIVKWFDSVFSWENRLEHQSILLGCLVHLRLHTHSTSDKDCWLPIDWVNASKAALRCNSFNLAVVLLENERAQKGILSDEAIQTLHDTFAVINEPDLFYARRTQINLDTLREKFVNESRNWNRLQIEASQIEASYRVSPEKTFPSQGLQITMSALGYSAISSELDSISHQFPLDIMKQKDLIYANAFKLERWDIPIPRKIDSINMMLYKVFHTLANSDIPVVLTVIDNSIRFMTTKFNNGTAYIRNKDCETAIATLVDCERFLSINSSNKNLSKWLQDIEEWTSRATKNDLNY
ncbi:Serine/threonine-protein kinase tel1 [Neolecta irregularis DAH-3]|uniref:Serine/threonine-protein kinase tel1 n=1 Tax=Neolecta irregularis (strain DAH-3) TaxID=1198029 RepID=A0A1U7LTP8_NEOID|nr:Serine/threonine-protein kinase tel1 [Neolecta irregularis DAH-3]|eukprot:OLL25988.1 Serine/threonine-protein kinase tel1 [Neolecta irregularis DAH-3]